MLHLEEPQQGRMMIKRWYEIMLVKNNNPFHHQV
jgi:hypothetical protein